MSAKKFKDVFVVTGSDDNPRWTKVGAAFVNRDGSLNVVLNALPVNGKLHIRDHVERQNPPSRDEPPRGEPDDRDESSYLR